MPRSTFSGWGWSWMASKRRDPFERAVGPLLVEVRQVSHLEFAVRQARVRASAAAPARPERDRSTPVKTGCWKCCGQMIGDATASTSDVQHADAVA